MSDLPPDWGDELRAACGRVRPEAAAGGVVRVELELGAVGSALLDRQDALAEGDGGPNSMHEGGASLARLELERLAAILRAELVEPIRRSHFADRLRSPLRREYGYLVDYGERGDYDLGLHVDESDLTLNLCLGDWFEGATLRFAGLRCGRHRQSPPRPEEVFDVEHAPGVGYLHLGTHRHLVPPLEQGRRRNLIVWCTADEVPLSAAMDCAPHCGDWRG